MSKEAINNAVNEVAGIIRTLTEEIEKNREALTPEAVEKIGFYLHSQLDIMVDEIRKLALPVAIPKPGSFSIDMEFPKASTARPIPREGRMVRAKPDNRVPGDDSSIAALPTLKDTDDIKDPDGAGFI